MDCCALTLSGTCNGGTIMSTSNQAGAESIPGKNVSPALSGQDRTPSQATQYASTWKLKDGTNVLIRPICPADESLMIIFHQTLSSESVYFRYLGPLKLSQRTEHERLKRICAADQNEDVALVAERLNTQSGQAEILGVGRLMKCAEAAEAEFALVVEDDCQGLGLGRQLLRRLIRVAREKGWRKVMGHILPDNRSMLHLSEKLGFKRIQLFGSPVVRMELDVMPGEGLKRGGK
jgi:acetyltransferase